MPSLKDIWEQTDRSGECWIWLGPVSVQGRPRMTFRRKRQHVSRVVWTLTKGPIPDGLQVCHTCDNPLCLRPKHFFLGTFEQNMDDKVRKGRQAKGERHGGAKLSETAILLAQRLKSEGWSQTEIARRLGVNQPAISRALRGQRWRHLCQV